MWRGESLSGCEDDVSAWRDASDAIVSGGVGGGGGYGVTVGSGDTDGCAWYYGPAGVGDASVQGGRLRGGCGEAQGEDREAEKKAAKRFQRCS